MTELIMGMEYRNPDVTALSAEGPAAQRLEAFLEGLPRNTARTQALIDFGTVLRDSNAAMRDTLAEREAVADYRASFAAAVRGLATFLTMNDDAPDTSLISLRAVLRLIEGSTDV